MTYDEVTNEYIFSSGKCMYANNGIIGIGTDTADVRYGYDGGVDVADLTMAERGELADFMIAQWLAFRGSIG